MTWKKSLVWWTCRLPAKSENSSRCTVLTEETSSVDEVFTYIHILYLSTIRFKAQSLWTRRITSKPNCCFSSLCTSWTDEVFSVSDMFTWNSSLTTTCPPLQAISSTPLDPSRRLWRTAHSAQAGGWDLFLSTSKCTSSQSPRCAKSKT